MLKNLDPLLTPDLLQVLRAMGHGDEIVLVDANYPAESAGPEVVRLDGIEATRVLDAVLSVMPLDDFVPEACWRMEVVGAAEGLFESKDSGKSWALAVPLAPEIKIQAGAKWANYGWDPINNIFYASQMTKPAYQFVAK